MRVHSPNPCRGEGIAFSVCFGRGRKQIAGWLLTLLFLFCFPLSVRAIDPVTICVLDTGCNAAEAKGWNCLDDTANIADPVGHGTAVCTLLAACAPDADIIMLKCFDSPESASGSAAIGALYAAADVYGADIICMSWTLSRESKALHDAIRYAHDSGAILLAPAGNLSLSLGLDDVVYPAVWDEVIGVGGVDVDSTGEPAASLWYLAGKAVYVCADGAYGGERGSSFAVPRIAAVVAEILENSPGQMRDSVLQALRDAAQDLGEPGYDPVFGWGYIKSSY